MPNWPTRFGFCGAAAARLAEVIGTGVLIRATLSSRLIVPCCGVLEIVLCVITLIYSIIGPKTA